MTRLHTLVASAVFSGYCSFSYERDFFVPHIEALHPLAFGAHGQFVNIGVPEMFVLEAHAP